MKLLERFRVEPEAVAPPRQTVDIDAESVLRRLEWQVIRRLDGILQGEYRSLFLGHGYDLAEVREYQAEDDVRYIDWNVTARMDTPYVRQYVEDREISAWLLIDRSASLDFGTAQARKSDLVLDFTGVISRLLTRRGNRVGAIFFSTGVDEVISPRGGNLQTLRLVHQITGSDKRSRHGVTDLADVLERAGGTIKRRSLVFIISDFISSSDWQPALGRLAQRNEVVAVHLRDPREEDLPPLGNMILEDAETGAQIEVDTSDPAFQRRFQAAVEQRRRSLETIFARNGVDHLTLSTDGDLVQDIARFAHLRRDLRRRQSPVAVESPVGG